MSINNKLFIEQKLSLIIGLAQLSMLLFLTHQINSLQSTTSEEGRSRQINAEVTSPSEIDDAEESVLTMSLSDLNRLAEKLALHLSTEEQFSKRITSAIRMELKELLIQSNSMSISQNKQQLDQHEDEISLEALNQAMEIFIASNDISIENINALFQKLGPLNPKQRQYVRQTIAGAINSGQANLILQ